MTNGDIARNFASTMVGGIKAQIRKDDEKDAIIDFLCDKIEYYRGEAFARAAFIKYLEKKTDFIQWLNDDNCVLA